MDKLQRQRQISRLAGVCRHLFGKDADSPFRSVYEDMEQGAIVGCVACLALTLCQTGGDISAAVLAFIASLGIFAGAVIGALLWISSAPLPEESIPTPAPSLRRRDRNRRR